MSWKCAALECQFENDDSQIVCSCCGLVRPSRLVLTAPSGAVWRTRIDTEISRAVYRHLYAGVEHQYVPRSEAGYPYSVIKSSTGAWLLKPNLRSPIRTVLNGRVCDGSSVYGLSSGDVVSIAAVNNPMQTKAPLTVSFQPLD